MNVILIVNESSLQYGNTIEEFVKEQGHNTSLIKICNSVEFKKAIEEQSKKILDGSIDRLICIDNLGIEPFIIASKIKGILCAQCYDEYSAYMTRLHNDAHVITLGSKIVGSEIGKSIVNKILVTEYEGGRHQIRLDMLK